MQQQEHLPSLGPSAYCYNKTNISKLRNKISVSDITILLERSNQLFQTIIEQQESHYICDGDKISKEKEFIEIYNNIAANGSTDILEIDLDIFDFVLFLCTHIRNSNEAMNIDLTKIVKYLAIDEHCVIQLIDLLLMHEQPLTMNLLNEKLFLIPADAILMLTMIWAEIKCEKVARLFEQYLSNPSDSDITEKDRKRAEEEFNKLLEMHLELYRDPNQEEAKMQEEFEKDMESALKIIKDQMDIREICNEATKLDQILSHVPEHSYRIVTVLDSTDESDSDNSEDDDICVFTRITSKWPNWLVDNLCQSNLDKHISMELKQCCFAPIGKLFVENPNAGKAKGYAKCLLLEKNNDRFVVQGISPKDGSSTVKAIIDRNDLALGDAPSIRCEEGTRVIALAEQIAENVGPWNTKYFAGTIGVQPFSQNRFEYLIFFDNGFDAYVKPEDIRLLINQPTDECGNFMPRNAHSKIPTDYKERTEFLRQYLLTYPDWPLIQLKKMENTQRVLATKNGIKESAYVLDIDRHLALLRFPGKVSWQNSSKECVIINCKEHKHFDEWVYRGNQSRFPTLLEYVQKMTGKINTIAKSSKRKIHGQIEMAYPIYKENFSDTLRWLQDSENKQTARKSAKRPIIENVSRGLLQRKVNPDKEMQRKKQQSMKVTEEKVKVPKWKYPKQTHRFCSPNCVQKIDSDPHAFDRSHISAYFIPLLYGWTRLTVNLITQIKKSKSKYWASERIQYIAPCGIKLNDIDQVAEYLRTTGEGRYEINNFTFDPQVRPNIRIKMENISIDDFTEGQETMKISLVNVVNNERAPKITYRPKRTGVVKNMTDEEDENSRKRINAMEIKNEFCSGCSCTDNCATNENCECRRLTIEAQNRLSESLQVDKSAKKGYFHRMLEERHLSGIYECNLHCKCLKSLCPNRVVQQDLKIPMQLFMTAEKGWGVRTLVDIPKYTFVCTYSGELLDEKVADEQGRKFGDKFLCDLNLVQIVEEEKMQQGIDLIGDEGLGADEEDEEEAHLGIKINQRSSGTMPSNFSDDEAIHEPSSSRQMVGAFEDVDIEADGDQPSEMDEIIRDEANKRQEGRPTSEEKANRPWKYNEFNAYFPNNFLFVIDAAMTGNIGRFLNHSCDPNCIIQNCFVDTHDLRLPWVAFFTTKFIKAGEELTWNYAYEVDSVEGKQIECYCGAANCIGRLL